MKAERMEVNDRDVGNWKIGGFERRHRWTESSSASGNALVVPVKRGNRADQKSQEDRLP